MRILILWADSRSPNLGVQVLAQGLKALAEEVWGDDVTVDFQDYGRGDSEVGFGNKSILKDLGRRNGPLKSKLRAYDLLIDSGAGDSFADIYGFQRLAWMFNAHRLAAKLRIPVILGPQTIGPFDKAWGRAMCRYMLRKALQVHTRDSESATYSTNIMRVTPDALSTDVVFALPVPKVENSYDVLLNVSGLLWQPNPHVDNVRYQRTIRSLIKDLQSNGRTVTLLSHVIENPRPDNDVPVCRALGAELGLDVVVPTNLAEAREAVAAANLVIGSRMHACLNALSTGTPSLPLAYSRKFAPLMNGIGWTHGFDLRDDVDRVAQIGESALSLLGAAGKQEASVLRERAQARLSLSAAAMKKFSRP
ncbi:polysaccharide pyruvyl transferase family protein [Pseudoclavibacter sp. RFBA6]|uniref:polysaccharide pyruvyl transferase family protein n=1 Tax=Pseudoclavibacter sp. RFBA6 TaxID=2080573 RepID=UPI0015E1FA11|nr:polysaccharide pyruvyl transferase family protein [Pseudoclavibacter sp. RFBA6]